MPKLPLTTDTCSAYTSPPIQASAPSILSAKEKYEKHKHQEPEASLLGDSITFTFLQN